MEITPAFMERMNAIAAVSTFFKAAPGGKVVTMKGAAQPNMIVSAEFEEAFPNEVHIFNLAHLIRFIKSIGGTKIEWEENRAKIIGRDGSVGTVYYCEPVVIKNAVARPDPSRFDITAKFDFEVVDISAMASNFFTGFFVATDEPSGTVTIAASATGDEDKYIKDAYFVEAPAATASVSEVIGFSNLLNKVATLRKNPIYDCQIMRPERNPDRRFLMMDNADSGLTYYIVNNRIKDEWPTTQSGLLNMHP